MKKKKGPKIIIALFIVVNSISLFWWFVWQRQIDYMDYESRQISVSPILTVDNYLLFSDEYETYYNDNLPFRNDLILLNSLIDFFIFDKSSNEDVIKGDNGWLFLGSTLEDYQGSNLYSQEELEKIREDVVNTKKYFDDLGIEFVIFIGPNKSSVYGDYMPSYMYRNHDMSRIEQVVNYIRENTDVTIIYPKTDLLVARKEYPQLLFYFMNDTHWNYMGGYFGSKPLLEALGLEVIPFEFISYEQVNEPLFYWNGYDLANMLGMSSVLNEDVNYHLSNYSTNLVTYDGNATDDIQAFYGFERTYSTSSDTRKVFLARDSFGESILPYLAAQFGEVVAAHHGAYTRSSITNEKPDIFIYEIVERSEFDVNIDLWD